MTADRSNAPHELASWEQKMREMAKPNPIYTPARVKAVTRLHYDCSAWLSEFGTFPPDTEPAILRCEELWQEDGLNLEKYRIDKDRVQILFAARPDVAPIEFVGRIKGRLKHALRQSGTPVKFSRKVAFRCLGDNISDAVAGYLRKQARKEDFADRRFARTMEQFTVVDEDFDLSVPEATIRGRYWYNLHLVFVIPGRMRIAQNEVLAKLRDDCFLIASQKDCRIKAVAVMLDHIHIALRGVVDQSPQDIALCFMNNLAWLNGYNRIWDDEYYAGTFSEYSLADLPLQRGKPVGGGDGGMPGVKKS
jgi:REP element-mobilizing transposase RayT